jgi:hypothetical protein
VALSVDEDVSDDQLRRRAREGLEHLVTLVEISEHAGRRGLWDAVVEVLEPGEARACAYAAALLAAEQQGGNGDRYGTPFCPLADKFGA